MRGLAVVWALVGVVVMLAFAVWRLSAYAISALDSDLTLVQIILLVAFSMFMAYSEGYKGFYLNFAPRFAARVKYVYREGRVIELVLSPFFCFGYFGTTHTKQIVSIILTLGLIMLVVLMRYVPQPWRGIVDVGVVIGLTLGIFSIIYCVYQELTSEEYLHDPQIPGLLLNKND